ncbi:Ribonuclease P protein subunit p25-like protein [Taenia solium]|eukprot:TsM_000821800 transcript=TsM_000821800 gene=TsM_000821800
MDPSLLSLLLDESRIRGYLKDNAIHMQVKAGTKVKNLIEYVSKRLGDGDCDQILCWGLPGAIKKVVPFAEKVKSQWLGKISTSDSPNLYQCTRLFFHLSEMRIEKYLVKANKPAMVILLSRQKFVETATPDAVSVIPTAEQEIPATETPFPSRRKKCHQQKKRRREGRDGGAGTFGNMTRPKKKAKRTQQEQKAVGRCTSEERISDPCHRLIPANNLSRLAVAKIKDVDRSPRV